MEEDQFNDTIHKIYAAASDFDLWCEALYSIEELAGSAGAVMNFVPRDHANPLTLAGRFSDEECAEYSNQYQSICPRISFAYANPNVPASYDSLVMTEKQMDADPVYDWFGKHGLRYYVGGHLSGTADHLVYFSLQRTRSAGHAEQRDIQLFLQLKSHLSQAVALAERVGTLGTRWRFTASLLDSLPHGIFLLSKKGELLFANATGDRLLSQADALSVIESRLVPRAEAERPAFDRMLHAKAGEGQWMRLSRGSGKIPYAVFVSRLVLQDPSPFGAKPDMAVVVHDLTSRPAFDVPELKQLYGLSDAESRVAIALSQGHDIVSASAALGVSAGTVRSHLKSIFLKMEVNRQQDLVRILTSLSGRF